MKPETVDLLLNTETMRTMRTRTNLYDAMLQRLIVFPPARLPTPQTKNGCYRVSNTCMRSCCDFKPFATSAPTNGDTYGGWGREAFKQKLKLVQGFQRRWIGRSTANPSSSDSKRCIKSVLKVTPDQMIGKCRPKSCGNIVTEDSHSCRSAISRAA